MSHAQLSVAHPRNPVHAGGGYPAHYDARPNPEGMAAIGSVLGVMVASGMIGTAVAAAVLDAPVAEVDVTADGVTEGEFKDIMKTEYSQLSDEWKAYNRKRHAIKAVLGTLGSAVGAYLGAGATSNRQKAAMYAAIGTGTVRLINVAAGMPAGFPGVLTGALGAYYGAKSPG